MTQPAPPSDPITDPKCRTAHHHLRNSMQVIMAHCHTLENKVPTSAFPVIQGIYEQIECMTQALAGCAIQQERRQFEICPRA